MRPAHIDRHYVKHKNFFFSCLQRMSPNGATTKNPFERRSAEGIFIF
jgi:hypothetical protein